MNDALKIMDLIECCGKAPKPLVSEGPAFHPLWQSLRTAIEEQRDWMALQDEKHTECAEAWRLLSWSASPTSSRNLAKAREELAQKDARIFELESAMLGMWKISQGGSISAAVMKSVIDGVMGES